MLFTSFGIPVAIDLLESARRSHARDRETADRTQNVMLALSFIAVSPPVTKMVGHVEANEGRVALALGGKGLDGEVRRLARGFVIP